MAQGKKYQGEKIGSQNTKKSTVKRSLLEMAEQTRLNKSSISEHINVERRHFQGVLPLGKELAASSDRWEN